MQCVLLWCIFSGIARGTLSAVNESPEQIKTIASFKRNSENSSDYKDFQSAPSLNVDKNQNSVNLLSVFHTPEDASPTNDNNALKRYDTMIPVVRFGRTFEQKRQSNSNSVIPYPRLGRSLSENANQVNYGEETSNIQNYKTAAGKNVLQENEDFEASGDENEEDIRAEDYETDIPFLESGSEYFESEITKPLEMDERDIDYILPQMRYGRSMLLVSPPETEESQKGKPPRTFVLPYPRPGRANKYEVSNSEAHNRIVPYPRPGRFDKTNAKRTKTNYGENQGYMLPSARLGRSTLDTLYELEGKSSMYSDDEGFLALKVNPLLLKSEEKNLSEKPKDKTENTSVFIIPYPRPGKRSLYKMNNGNRKQKSSKSDKEITDYVLPYPRPGRRSARQQLQKIQNSNGESSNIQSRNFIVPYPRPGRSMDFFIELDDEINQNNINEPEDLSSGILRQRYSEDDEDEYDDDDDDDDDDHYYEETNSDYPSYKSSDETSDNLRYKRSTSVVPYPRLGRSDSVVPYPRLGRTDSVVQYSKLKESNSLGHSRLKKAYSVIPFPRLGRTNSVIPYPRFGRTNAVVPYPRPGRSGFVVPSARSDRSESLVPYPRSGRSDSVVPYPRPGRSGGIVPYPRPGRASGVVPYPRPGRASGVVPYPRPGRASGVVPYPRPGRTSGIVPYPRPGRASSLVPYPRPGRTSGVVPYPRPGRASGVVPYPRPGRTSGVVPYPRPGRSDAIIPYPRAGKSGRSGAVVPYPRLGRSNSIVPYPRPGKSLSVVPYPRTGRSEKISSTNSKTMGNWVLPNIRPGRSNFNKKDSYSESANDQINKEEFRPTFLKKGWTKDAVIPYPRFGRSKKGKGYILPHPRIGKSGSDRSKRDITVTDTVIPYPRLGRSQKTPSSNSAHKLNKHMLTNADSVYLLPYPRPGRSPE